MKQLQLIYLVGIILSILAVVIIIVRNKKENKQINKNVNKEYFANGSVSGSVSGNGSTNFFNNPEYEKNRTKLYGSLFLDNLDEQIKNMTDPRITYDDKRIEIIKYDDVLL